VQPGLRTVQAEVEAALATVLRRPGVRVTCAGRTDAGVHARGQVVHVDVPATTYDGDAHALGRRLTGVLPPDVGARAVRVAPLGFDARFSPLWRRYAYRLTEHPFGPGYTVSTLSYVLSLLPPDLWHDLDLAEHGLFVYPQGPYFAPRRDGRYLQLPDDPARRAAAIEPFSKTDAEAYERWEAWLSRLGRLVGPLLHAIPPTLGSRRPRDLVEQAGLLARLRGIDVRAAVDLTRLFSASVADLVEDRFSSDAMRGLLSVSGVIGMWAGPRSAGTGFVTLHHHLDQTGAGAAAWGFPRGGMGAVTQALAGSARSFGAEIRTSTEVARIDVRGGEVVGVTLHNGSALTARTVVATVHPRIAFLTLVGREHLPEDFVADIEAWRSRSGTVKVNFAVDRLPTLEMNRNARYCIPSFFISSSAQPLCEVKKNSRHLPPSRRQRLKLGSLTSSRLYLPSVLGGIKPT